MLFQLGVDLKRIYPPILDPPNGLAGVPNSRSSKQDGVKDLCFVGGGFVHGDTYTVYIYIYRCEGLSHLAPTKGELALAIGASGQF